MEEWVGYKWHQYITRQALGGYPDQAVTLREQARTLGLLFRALGGDPALHLVSAEPRHFRVRRRLLHRIAGTHRRFELAWRDADSLRLPERIALFPDRELNRALYLWLAALAASPPSGHDEWFTANQAMTEAVLTRWPGLEAQYQQLVRHILQGRPRPGDLPEPEAAREEAIRQALIHPGSVRRLPPACHDPWPVFLWLYPVPETEHGRVPGQDDDSGTATSGGLARKRKRRKAERVEAFDKDRGLMIFRLESLFSWSEFIPVDRAGDDTEEKDAEAVADDMDLLSVSGDRREASASIRLDLDLPAEDHDDLRLGPGIHLPEWDWAPPGLPGEILLPATHAGGFSQPAELPERLRAPARRLQRQFSTLKPLRQWHRRQLDGEELDLDACIEREIQRQRRRGHPEQRLFRQCRQSQRDLACLVLADISLSTESCVSHDQRVIDVARDGLQLLAEALHASRDPFALFAFSSRRRDHVRFHHIKAFEESWSSTIRGRIQALEPGYYTRMGAAIRQATRLLQGRHEHQRILLLLTDGKPNDLDLYEGRYGVEDTRMAVQEALRAGVTPFCVTIDDEASEYLPYIFGSNHFVVIRDPVQLPLQLPKLYMRLTQ